MAGVLVIALGAVVLVVAVIALQRPNGNRVASSDRTSTVTASGRASASPTPSASRTRSAPPSTTSSSRASSSTPPSTGTSDSAHSVPLVVLNNTTTSGLASQAATKFESGGWTVTSYGNYSNDIVSTCAYYDPSVKGAKTAAEALMAQYPAIKRIKEKFAELPAGPVVVVLTPDYSPN